MSSIEVQDALEQERDRVRSIIDLGARHNMREFAERAVAQGTSLQAFRGVLIDELHKRGSDRPLAASPAHIGLSERETRQFSITRLMSALLNERRDQAPFEIECSRAVEKALALQGRSGQAGGAFLPAEVLGAPLPGARMADGRLMVADRVIASQRDLSTSTSAAGGAMVGTNLLASEFATLLRARTMVVNLGARVMSGLVGNVAIPRQTGTVNLSWVAQAGAATESDATFSQITLSPKTAHGIQDVTRDLLLQGTPATEGIVRADLLDAMGVALDYAALNGTGTSNQPTGLANTAGIGTVAGGANGLAPTWDHMVELESQVANANSYGGGYLTNSKVRGKLKRTQRFSGTDGAPIWAAPTEGRDPSVFGTLNDYLAGVSNNVRSDLTKGTSSGVCSAIFFGAWSDLLIGEWGSVEILPDRVTQAANRIVRFHVYQTIDIAVRRPQSFAAMLDALTV